MTGDLKCPACEVFHIDPCGPNADEKRVCTGRAGCVRHPDRETPAPDSAPAGANVPVGKADGGADPVLDALREVRSGNVAGYMGPEVVILSREQHDSVHAVVMKLRAEVERLTGERGELLRENMAMVDAAMIADVADRPDRAALATRVAEAVREACADVARARWRDAASAQGPAHITIGIRALDLGPIVAAALAKEGE